MPSYTAEAFYRPAANEALVGGDFYDAFHTPAGWVLLVGDIAGHGVKAASLTAQARHVIRSTAMFSGDLERAVRHLNRVLCAEEELSLCSVCAMLLPDDPDRLPARLICAGHPRPILVKHSATLEVGEFGPMVGAFPDSDFLASEIFLSPSDMLVLYTDGLVDARGAADRLGVFRLRDALRPSISPGDAVSRIQDLLEEFQHGPQADDTAVVALMRNPAPRDTASPIGLVDFESREAPAAVE
jgi:sigma-B regulation protein RsbU (phosphoserine phosphatase)